MGCVMLGGGQTQLTLYNLKDSVILINIEKLKDSTIPSNSAIPKNSKRLSDSTSFFIFFILCGLFRPHAYKYRIRFYDSS